MKKFILLSCLSLILFSAHSQGFKSDTSFVHTEPVTQFQVPDVDTSVTISLENNDLFDLAYPLPPNCPNGQTASVDAKPDGTARAYCYLIIGGLITTYTIAVLPCDYCTWQPYNP